MQTQSKFDAFGTVLTGILLGTVGVLSFIVQPGLVQGFVTELGLSEASANQLAFDEMLAVAIATCITTFLNRRIDWQILVATGLCLAGMGNLASAYWLDSPTFLSLARFVTGLGEGVVISLSFTIIGLTSRTERNLAAYLVLLLSYGAIGLWLMPSAFDSVGLQGIFGAWGLVSLVTLLTLRYVPKTSHAPSHFSSEKRIHNSVVLKGIALLGVLLFNLAIGVAWANLFLMGMEITPNEQKIADALLICQFIAVVGALIPVFLEGHLGTLKPISVTIVFSSLAILSLLIAPDYATFVIATCVFNALWNFGLPFILSGVGAMDSRGYMISMAIALQMTGLSFGPFFASLVLSNSGDFNSIKILIISLYIASAPPLIYALRKHKALCLRRV